MASDKLKNFRSDYKKGHSQLKKGLNLCHKAFAILNLAEDNIKKANENLSAVEDETLRVLFDAGLEDDEKAIKDLKTILSPTTKMRMRDSLY